MDLTPTLERVAERIRPHLAEGQVAGYIPALARADPARFGIAVVSVDGRVSTAGDARATFSIQSISKVFTLTMALGKVGGELWKWVGREPSGSSFNSIVQLEREGGVPRNPFINAGAIMVTDVLLDGRPPQATIDEILAFVRRRADDPTVAIDEDVARSEATTGHRNYSLAHFLAGFGRLRNPVDAALSVYFHQCALSMSCVQLARAGLFLAASGRDPLTGEIVVAAERARRINALMLTCGHYDASGDVAFRIGLPGKSGVGGGILAIVPKRAAIAVWSPGLNPNGNSHAGTIALEMLAAETGWSVF